MSSYLLTSKSSNAVLRNKEVLFLKISSPNSFSSQRCDQLTIGQVVTTAMKALNYQLIIPMFCFSSWVH